MFTCKQLSIRLRAHFRRVYCSPTVTAIRLIIIALCIMGIIALIRAPHRRTIRARICVVPSRSIQEPSNQLPNPKETAPPELPISDLSAGVLSSNLESLVVTNERVDGASSTEPEEFAYLSADVSEAPQTTSVSSAGTVKTRAAVPPRAPTVSFEVQEVRISDIRPGDRLPGVNPEGSDAVEEALLSVSDLCVYTLRVPKPDGSFCTAKLLRSADWLETQPSRLRSVIDGHVFNEIDAVLADLTPLPFEVYRDFEPEVWLELEEQGCVGWSQVVEIEPFAYLSGEGNLVTGTFEHTVQEMIDLQIEDQERPIGCTPTHPFWSEDRQEFVLVGELLEGERVRTYNGDTKRVVQKLPRPGPELVYNLEVAGEHVYLVTSDGILVHNSCDTYRRSYIRKSTKAQLLARYSGKYVTLKGKHLGHKKGLENWRLVKWADEKKLTRKQWNRLSNHHKLYKIENPTRNMKRIDEDKSPYDFEITDKKLRKMLGDDFIEELLKYK